MPHFVWIPKEKSSPREKVDFKMRDNEKILKSKKLKNILSLPNRKKDEQKEKKENGFYSRIH